MLYYRVEQENDAFLNIMPMMLMIMSFLTTTRFYFQTKRARDALHRHTHTHTQTHTHMHSAYINKNKNNNKYKLNKLRKQENFRDYDDDEWRQSKECIKDKKEKIIIKKAGIFNSTNFVVQCNVLAGFIYALSMLNIEH